MSMLNFKRLNLWFVVAVFMLIACEDDNTGDPNGEDTKTGTIKLAFNHEVGSQSPLLLDTMLYTNKAGNHYGVSKLEYIVTRFRFHKKDGEYVERDTAHYRKAGDKGTMTLTLNNIPHGTYEKVTFIHGLDSASNKTNALPPKQVFNNMGWPDGGYHYMRMNGNYDSAGNTDVFTTHTGPTNGEDHSVLVALEQSFKVDDADRKVNIVMDLNQWYQDPHAYDFSELKSERIMGNPSRQDILEANGHNVYSVKGIKVE